MLWVCVRACVCVRVMASFLAVAFDIETTGLLHETPLPEITCVCFHCEIVSPDEHEEDEDSRIQSLVPPPPFESNVSLRLMGLAPDERAANVRRIGQLLDDAGVILGFNAVLFDLEFVRRALGIDDARAQRWVLKCVDPYMYARLIWGSGCGMNYMLALNGLEGKTGDGKHAIEMARDGEWPALLSYCYMDAKLTFELCAKEWLRITPAIEAKLNWGRSAPTFRLFGLDTSEKHGQRPLLRLDTIPLWDCSSNLMTAAEADAEKF